jgi:YD repeat-containing protein
MKTIRLLALGLLVATPWVWAQDEAEFTGPGWFNAGERSAFTNVPSGEGAVQAASGGEAPEIAEASTPEIEALARGLENDPARIFNWVREHIRHVLYFGSKKGAQLTLLERSGNDFDQCALLVALLRAGGHEASYQFGLLKMPFESEDRVDLRHWLGLSLTNADWTAKSDCLRSLLDIRGYPLFPGNALFFDFGDSNTVAFHRVWVKWTSATNTYYLDPAFKVGRPAPALTNLAVVMGLDTNQLLSAAGGGGTADYVTNLTEATLRGQLRDYTTNLLTWMQGHAPNASVTEILGGWRIEPATNAGPSLSLQFSNYSHNGQMPVVDWQNQPTNLMSRLTLSFAGTNYRCFVPELQGRRLSLTFSTNGLAQLWLDDTNVVQVATSGGATINVTTHLNHPFGLWYTNNNSFVDTAYGDHSDQADPAKYQRQNAIYALIYAFDARPERLRWRQERLDAYRQRGLADTSREVMSETLNVMGLHWFYQTELVARQLAAPGDLLPQSHHRFGRMAQEQNQGYYVDVYLQLNAWGTATGDTAAATQRRGRAVDVQTYFASAFEHALIEQMQAANLVGASTIKMLQLANTNALRVFVASTTNWTTNANVRGQLTNYNLAVLDAYINAGFTLLLPRDGARPVAGSGTWKGHGAVGRFADATSSALFMLISGGYNGGYVSSPAAQPSPAFVSTWHVAQPNAFNLQPPSLPPLTVGDPVNIADGSFTVDETDLTAGAVEPRGFSFARHYSSARRHHNLAGLGQGWTHNYYFTATQISAPEAGLGLSTPQQMAPMLVATLAAMELYQTNADPKNWLVTALIAKWGVDQLINNGVSVTLGNDTVQFIQQPDGSFTPPAGSTLTLFKTNSAYRLVERHGRTFQFNHTGLLTNLVDQYNQGLKLTYGTGAASNWVATATDWKNRRLTFGYGGTPTRLLWASNSAGGVVTYGYATNAGQLNLVSVTDPENQTRTFLYDTNHQIVSVKSALAQVVTTNVYDSFGRVTEQYSEGNLDKTWRFYWSGDVNSEEDPAGGKRRFHYDDKSRLVALENTLGHMSRTFYDGQDHVTMTVSPLNETNRFEYDGRHNRLRAVDSLGSTNHFFYDAQNRLVRTADARAVTNYFGYNAKHQLIARTNGAGDWTTFSHDATTGLRTGRTDTGGTTTFAYDAFGLLNSVTHPGGLGGESFLNHPRGDVTNHTNPRGFVTRFQYNQRRQLTNTIAPTNLTAKVIYDAVGNVQTTVDARTNTITYFWSPTRKPIGTLLPATPQGVAATTNIYDTRDWLALTRDPLQQPTWFTNDAAGRLISARDPLGRATRSTLDANGRMLGTTNAADEVTHQEWNARGELAKFADGANRTVLHAYDPAGNQISLTNRNGKRWQFQYDAANRPTNTITPLTRQTWQMWNNRGLLGAVREPSGQWTTNHYDAKGRLTNRVDGVAPTVYRYDANNNLTNIVENGKTNTWTFDAYDRVQSYRDADGYLIQYRYDASGNLTNLIYPGNRVVAYAYDSLNRLTNVTDWAERQTHIEYDLPAACGGSPAPTAPSGRLITTPPGRRPTSGSAPPVVCPPRISGSTGTTPAGWPGNLPRRCRSLTPRPAGP